MDLIETMRAAHHNVWHSMNPEVAAKQRESAPWLMASVVCTGLTLASLAALALLPFDPDLPEWRGNQAIAIAFAGSLLSSILAAVSVVRSDRLRGVAALWCLMFFLLAVVGSDLPRLSRLAVASVFG